MIRRLYKSCSLFLTILLILTGITVYLTPVFARSPQVYKETFDNLNHTGTNHTTGSFLGNYGITWYYQDTRGDVGNYAIEGKGIVIRRSNGYSKVYGKGIPGGIGSFSVDLKKFFTTTDPRTVELVINGVPKGTFTLEQQEDETFPVQTFTVENINIEGNFDLELRHALSGSSGAAITVDNITWTAYKAGGNDNPQPLTLDHIPISSVDIGNAVAIQFSTSNNEIPVASMVYYRQQRDHQFFGIKPALSKNTSTATIPAAAVTEDIQYYIEVVGVSSTARHPEEGVHTIAVVEPHNPEKPISIENAINRNRGLATVEGYIVATLTSGPVYHFEEPFLTNTNLALADLPEERDGSKILPVQLPDNILRRNLNLINNPGNVGKKVQITGSLGRFASVPGLTGLSAYKWVDSQEKKVSEITTNPVAGVVEEGTKVTLSTTTEDAMIYYTLDGSLPDENSNKYEEAIPINTSTTITAVACKPGFASSDIATFLYEVLISHKPVVASVTAAPKAGAVVKNTFVELSTITEDAAIYYTTDGSIPNEGSTKYIEPIVITENTLIKAIGAKEGMENSFPQSFSYSIIEIVDTPQIHTITAVGNEITLSWNAVDGAIYELIRREVESGLEMIIPVAETSYTDTVAYRASYEYQVRAIKTREGETYQSELSEGKLITIGAAYDEGNGSSSDEGSQLQEPKENPPIMKAEEIERTEEVEEILEIKSGEKLTDIEGHWAEGDIKKLVELRVIRGYRDGSFRPENSITRAEFVTMLVKALDIKFQEGKRFHDTSNHWGKDYIAAATARGFVGGYKDTTFGPDDFVTREQMAIMVVKAMELEGGLEVKEKEFADKEKISFWAKDYIMIAISYGIVTEYEDNSFNPQGEAKRGEAANMIMKILEMKQKIE